MIIMKLNYIKNYDLKDLINKTINLDNLEKYDKIYKKRRVDNDE